MAGDLNRVILVGRLTRDPEMKATNKGSFVCRISLASNRYIYNKESGEGRDEAGFFDCIAFGRTAETVSKYLKKGSRIGVDGSLRWSSWENQEGKKNSKVEIMIESFQFLDTKGARDGDTGGDRSEKSDGGYRSYTNNSGSDFTPDSNFDDEDIPF